MMPDATPSVDTTTRTDILVLAIVLPVVGILLSLALGGKFFRRVTLALFFVGFAWRSKSPSGAAKRSIACLHCRRLAAAPRDSARADRISAAMV